MKSITCLLTAIRIAFIGVFIAFPFSLNAKTGGMVALVIGNGAYTSVPALPNPTRDSDLIASKLTEIGFEVTHLNDLGQMDLMRALQKFKRSATGAKTAVVYYAGHGIEVNRINYFVPIDARLETDTDVTFEAVPLDIALSAVAQASDLSLVIVDACRNNPFATRMVRELGTRSVGRGLVAIEPQGNTLVAYSAKEGTVALDGEGQNSPYARALVDALSVPQLEIGQLFRQVRDVVLQTTSGMQEPFTYGSLSSKSFYLNASEPPPPVVAASADPAANAAAAAPQPDAGQSDMFELALWGLASNTNKPEGYQEYLRQYPTGRFAFFAQQRLSELMQDSPPEGVELAAVEPEAPPPPVVRDADPTIPAVLTRDQVRLAQESLEVLGFDPGGHDGIHGARTASAVMKYQRTLGAPETGELTAHQYDALIASVTEAQRADIRARQPAPKKVVRYKAPATTATKTAPATTETAAAEDDSKSNYKALDNTYGRVGVSGHVCRIRADLCEAGWD